jgi:hypothetical protein
MQEFAGKRGHDRHFKVLHGAPKRPKEPRAGRLRISQGWGHERRRRGLNRVRVVLVVATRAVLFDIHGNLFGLVIEILETFLVLLY